MTTITATKRAIRPIVFTRRLTREQMRHGRLVEWRQFGGKSTVGILLRRPSHDDPDATWLVTPMSYGGVQQQLVPWPAVERGEFFVAPPQVLGDEDACTLARWLRRELTERGEEKSKIRNTQRMVTKTT